MTIRGCLGQHMNCVRTLGALKKEERRKKKMTKFDFHRFQVRHFSENLSNLMTIVRMGQRQRADLSVLRHTKFNTRGNIGV